MADKDRRVVSPDMAKKRPLTGVSKTQEEIDKDAAGRAPGPGAVDRPGFDLGGSTGDTQAGSGLGLGVDAAEDRSDRSLPGRRTDSKLTIPRWNGPGPAKTPPGSKD